MSLMDMVKGQITQAVLGKLGGMLGESADKTSAGINAAVPTILDGIIRKASTKDGANWLEKELGNHDGGILDNIGGMFEPSKSAGIADKGIGLLGSLMGNGVLGNVVGLISRVSGLGSGSSRSMLGMLMPIVMGVLGKHQRSSGMDLGSLVGFLNEQKPSVASALPSGLADAYATTGSTQSAGSTAAASRTTTSQARPAATKSGGGGLGWLLPLLAIPLLCFLGWTLLKGGSVGDAVGKVGDGVGGAVGAVGDGVGNVAGAVGDGVGAVADGAGSLAGAAADGVGNAAGAVGDGLGAAAGAVGDGVGGVAGAVGDGVGAAAGAVGDGVGALSGGIQMPSLDFSNPQSVIKGLPGMFDGAKETFGGITDVESAKGAVGGIEGLTKSFGGLGQGLGVMPEAAQGAIKEQVGGFIPVIQGMIEKVMAIPGVEPVLGPAVNGLMEKLAVFGG